MRFNSVYTNNINPSAPDELLKITSLLYLKEALSNQQYEQCAELIQSAKKYGARQTEVRKAIAEHFRRERAGQPYEAESKIGGRLRFLKEE